MEQSVSSEYIHIPERASLIVTKPVFGDKVKGDLLDERNVAWYTALENESAPHITEWNDRTIEKWKKSKPRVAIPLDLPANATPLEAYRQLPTNSSLLTSEGHEGAIVAAGFPIWELLNIDNPDTVHDDAMRMYYEKLAHDIFDPEQRRLQTKLTGIVKEQGPERVLSMGSSIAPTLAKVPLHPVIGASLLAGRLLLSARSVAHNFLIDRIDDTIELDPEVYANIKWFTKPLTERARDNELRDAAMALLLPQTIEVLEKMGISGNAVPLVDESHTSARYIWRDTKRQERVIRYNVRKMAEFRQHLAGHRKMRHEDWDSFAEEVTKFIGSVKIFEVTPGEEPNPPSISSIRNKHIPRHMFISRDLRSIVSDTIHEVSQTPIDERLAQLVREEEDLYPGSDINDF